MKLEITKKTLKSFKGDDGEERDYYWYTAKKQDGFSIRFGSTEGGYDEGETHDIALEEYEQSNGRKGYKELT